MAPRAISHATRDAPNRLAMIASIISQIAAPMLATNGEDKRANTPMITMAIPQRKAPKAKSGLKINTKIPRMPPIPMSIRMMLPINARMKPIFAKVLEVLEIRFTSYREGLTHLCRYR